MPAALSDLERRILDYMVRYLRANTFQPSIREIGDAVGLASPSSVAHQLKVLQRKGYLHRDQNRPRAMEIQNPGQPPVRADADTPSGEPGRAADVPVVGRIAAGGPILAQEAVSVLPGDDEETLHDRIKSVEHRLYPGDSLHLRSNAPHRLYNDTDRVTTVVSVVTPRLV
jgi:hypothetical protein